MERSDIPTGYYSPNVKPDPLNAHTFVIAHKYIDFPLITKDKIQDSLKADLRRH